MNRPARPFFAPVSPPWSATASVLVAFAALALNEDAASKRPLGIAFISIQAVAPIVFSAVAILISFLIRVRLERGRPAVWTVRAGVVGAAILYALATSENIHAFYYFNFISRVIGLIFVGECALQHWQRPPPGQQRGGLLVFLAMIVFVLASRTHVQTYIKYFTPPFIVLLVLSMRACRQRGERTFDGLHPWLAALFLAVFAGGAGALWVAKHDSELSRVLHSILKPSNYNEFSDVNARPVLGKSFNQPLSQKRVMRIEGIPAERHMRGMAFETYTSSGAWGPAVEARGQEDAGLSLKARPGGQRLTVTPLIDNLAVLYVPLHMDGLDARAYKLLWSPEWGGPIFASSSLSTAQPYQITIVNETHKGPLCNIINDRVRERCLDLRELDPFVADLAKRIGKDATNPREKLEAIRRHLYSHHSYSLDIDPGIGDPIVNFLRRELDGHCQYFAAASVLLARSMGVPARYVTGYYAHESPDQEVTIVRQRDAHAWAEVWIDGEGWSTFDATPSGGMPGQSGGVSFWSRLWEKIGDMAESFGAWLRQAPLTHLALLIGAAVAMGIVIRWIRQWRAAVREARPRVLYASAGRGFEALAAAFDDWLRRKGAPCPPNCPWLDHLARLKETVAMRESGIRNPESARQPAVADPETPINLPGAEAFARDYTAARFGGSADNSTLADLVRKFKEIG